MIRIPLSAPLMLAARRGEKTVTRRSIWPLPESVDAAILRWKVGEVVAFTEAFRIAVWPGDDQIPDDGARVVVEYLADGRSRGRQIPVEDWEKICRWKNLGRGMPPMYMMPSLARAFTRIVSVRAERLQNITDDEVRREGVQGGRDGFSAVWDRINGARHGGALRWERNPIIARIEWADGGPCETPKSAQRLGTCYTCHWSPPWVGHGSRAGCAALTMDEDENQPVLDYCEASGVNDQPDQGWPKNMTPMCPKWADRCF